MGEGGEEDSVRPRSTCPTGPLISVPSYCRPRQLSPPLILPRPISRLFPLSPRLSALADCSHPSHNSIDRSSQKNLYLRCNSEKRSRDSVHQRDFLEVLEALGRSLLRLRGVGFLHLDLEGQ